MFSSQIGPFTLLKRLAIGGMGEIFLAQKNKPNEMQSVMNSKSLVALKKILPHLTEERDFVDRFVDEARLMISLQHPNILPVYELRHDQWGLYMVMEYLEGFDVRSINRFLAQQEERWPPYIATWLIKELCQGLAYAHQKSDEEGQPLHLVHRDISPSNILLSQAGEVKLIDFGVAKAKGSVHRSMTGALQGKLAYMSPEQARGEAIDHRTDLYAVGVTLYEMLAGVRPREGDNEAHELQLAQEAQDLALEDVWPEGDLELCSIVNRCLKSQADERFNDSQSLLEALDQYLDAHVQDIDLKKELILWLSSLELKRPKEQMNLNQAMELQLAEFQLQDSAVGSPISSLHSSGGSSQETLSINLLTESNQPYPQQKQTADIKHPTLTQDSLNQSILVSAEKQHFSSVLEQIVNDPELLEFALQEQQIVTPQLPKVRQVDLTRLRSLLGSLSLLLVLMLGFYWSNRDEKIPFELNIVFPEQEQLTALKITQEVDPIWQQAITIDQKKWNPHKAYSLKQPIELCIQHPQWKAQCHWLSLNDLSLYEHQGKTFTQPQVYIQVSKNKPNQHPLSESFRSMLQDDLLNSSRLLKQKSEQKQQDDLSKVQEPRKEIEQKTFATQRSKKLKNKNKTPKKMDLDKAKSTSKSKLKSIKIELSGLESKTNPRVYCGSKQAIPYQLIQTHTLLFLEPFPQSNCHIEAAGYAPIKIDLVPKKGHYQVQLLPKGTLSLRVYPPAAKIKLNGKPMSNPINEQSLIGREHHLSMIYQGLNEQGKTIELQKEITIQLLPGQRIRKYIDLNAQP